MSSSSVNWISVGDLAESFRPDSNALRPTADLVGRSVDLAFADGRVIRHRFTSADMLTWQIGTGPENPERYFATAIRPNLYLVDFVKSGTEAGLSVTLVLDVDAAVATAVLGRLPSGEAAHAGLLERAQRREELTLVDVTFEHASIGDGYQASAAHHVETDDLVGLRIRHRYSPTELYEHIYLNARRYCWHCIQGSEEGLGDVDRCHFYKIRPDLYLFIWREKIVPTLGVVLIDLGSLKTTGKIFGYEDFSCTSVVSFPMGAHSTVANRTPSGL